MQRWYVAQTLPHQERVAREHLLRQRFQIFLPEFQRESHKRGLRITVASLFPGYLFVGFDVDDDRWKVICSTRGVRRLLGSDPERPLPVPVGIVEDIHGRCLATGYIEMDNLGIKLNYKKGDPIRIMDGPFRGMAGLYQGTAQQRIMVLLDILRRGVVVSVPASLVEPVL